MAVSTKKEIQFAEVLLPLAIPKTYTYSIPQEFVDQISFGIRVEVPLRNKLYSGIVINTHNNPPDGGTRFITSVLDKTPVINSFQFEFWEWISRYYCCKLGEVMNVAIPSGLKLSSETKFVLNNESLIDTIELSDDEYLVTEAMTIQREMTADVIQDILNKKTIYPVIKSLMEKRVLYVKEELKQKYKPRLQDFIQFNEDFKNDVEAALEYTTRSEKQTRALLALASLSRKKKWVAKKAIYEMAGVDNAVVNALIKKGLVQLERKEVSRIEMSKGEDAFDIAPMSEAQSIAFTEITNGFDNDKVCLLHGITGSGKTRIYIEFILNTLKEGGQVLLMLPEIALTTQIVSRLKRQIGENLLVYHSKVNDHSRVEIWNKALYADQLFVGARSALFLPFYNLKLIIVDEEHDPSYKQDNPNPRYHGRDSAVMLARMFGAKILLGSATPSLESIYNVKKGKYHYVKINSRYGDAVLPDVEIVDLKESYKKGLVKNNFSKKLLDEISETVTRKEQVILFQNRRGYAPVQRCNFCSWTAGCPNCDVSLTYHQSLNELKCHYCGYRQSKTNECPSCGNDDLQLFGIGTQKIEEFLKSNFPEFRVSRFDYDTTRSKENQENILYAFKNGEIDILVGTQMITKGFDFDNISLVGIVSADSLFAFPDFRATERSFQLLVQVSGRAGRRKNKGKVIIQTFNKDHPVLTDVIKNRTEPFYERELTDRKEYVFPPYYNLIAVWLKHVDFDKTKQAAIQLTNMLTSKLGKRIQGPIDPPLIRVRNRYRQIIYIRFEKESKAVNLVKGILQKAVLKLREDKNMRSVRIAIDVDPY